MATKVQAKYFPGSMMDLNNGLYNVMWDPYHDDRNQGYNSFLMSQTMDGYLGYPKEQMRQTILKQESIFRHQLQELHRLYKRQRDLMNEFRLRDRYNSTIPTEAQNSSHFLSQICTQRRVIDLELPANVEEDNIGNQPVKNVHNSSTRRPYNLADLNEPIQMEEASFAASHINKNSDYCVTDNVQKQILSTNSKFWCLQTVPKRAYEHLPRTKKIFGVELCESSHKPPFDSSRGQNTSTLNCSRWTEPHNGKNLEKQLPHWLTKTKGKETILYQMNLDSLQQHSQQFFKKAEKLQTGNLHGVTKILGVPITNSQASTAHTHDKTADNDKSNQNLGSRHEIDLNLSFDEEEDLSTTPNIPETAVSSASMEIDLEAPAALEAETDDCDHELVKSAAEAIISISSSDPPPADTLLRWFAEVITSGEDDQIKRSVNMNKDEDCIPEGMDYLEYMTLKLQETEADCHHHKAMTVVEMEEDDGLLKKPVSRKGQGKRGRQRKDFQRDVLPGIVSLSRREVSEDLQTFEEAFSGIGVAWQSKRKAGRGRRRSVVLSPRTPPPTPPEVAVERSVCREVGLQEQSLGGWGKRTRRLPRQRCQNGGNHQSLALKC